MIITNPTHDAIIQLLGNHGEMSVKQILYNLKKQERSIKQAQLYNVLRTLEQKLFIYKKWSSYIVHPAWLEKLQAFMQRTQHMQKWQQIKPGEHKHIRSESFVEMCKIRPYYAALAHKQNPSKEQWKYCRHHAYSLSMIRKKITMPDFFVPTKHRYYDLCYTDNFLNTYALQFSRIKKEKSIVKKCNLFNYQWYNINIIGEYLLEVHLWPFVQNQIDSFFNNTNSLDTFDIEYLRELLLCKEQTTLIIRHDPEQAQKRKSAIQKEILKQ